MKELLSRIQINQFEGFLYEYAPVSLDWWNLEHKTAIEIGIHPGDERGYEIQIIFSPHAEGIIPISVVMELEVEENFLPQTALVEKSLCKKLMPDHQFEVLEEQNACVLAEASDIKAFFEMVINLIEERKPVFSFDTNALEDLTDSEPEYVPGETLDHFIAMMRANGGVYTPRVIESNLHFAQKFESPEYIPDLKKDAEAELTEEVIAGFRVDEEILERVKKLILAF